MVKHGVISFNEHGNAHLSYKPFEPVETEDIWWWVEVDDI